MDLSQFLVKAKMNAYAGGERASASVDGSHEFSFQEDAFRYRDRYFGFNPFMGGEIVWQDGKAIWGLNYYGKIYRDVVPASEVYQFLQMALRQIQLDRPFRGPDSHKDQEFEYRDESYGSIDLFAGTERIFYRGEEIYRLDYHGGLIK